MDCEKKYKEALERAKEKYAMFEGTKQGDVLEDIFPELKESKDERIRKALVKLFESENFNGYVTLDSIDIEDVLAWLENQGEPNPYSGVSFKYNGHTWGMCARDNGVDILCDKLIIGHLEKQGEQSQYWKPSEEQLEALDYAYNSCSDTERGNYYEGVLETLIEDLHRLEKQGEKPVEEYNITGICPKHAEGKLGEMIKNMESANKVEPKFHEGEWIIIKE